MHESNILMIILEKEIKVMLLAMISILQHEQLCFWSCYAFGAICQNRSASMDHNE